ncbi:MAG: DUF5690 family protein [Candidatus Aminicenantes bacterium]|nr:DUF5690 family protein [Candidatus Aminicenantes bacterium]
MTRKAAVTTWLEKRNGAVFTVYASFAAFAAYFCMYAFRKPFAVAQFAGFDFLGMDYKTILIIAQILGYMLSKGIGIKIIAELIRARRPLLMVLFMGIAEAALVLFAVVPPPANVVFLFMNGLPLGLIWGIVFSYIEGRKRTDIMAMVLCSSFVLASGFVKTVGKVVMNWGVSEFSMPFVTGAIFFGPLLASLWMLESLPPPTDEDRSLRTERIPMRGPERRKFFLAFAPGLVFMLAANLGLTAFRDFRDNYMADIWQTLGRGRSSAIFTATEAPIALGVLIVLALLLLVKDNFRALVINHLAILSGFAIVGAATLLYERQLLPPAPWMILVGFGLFLSYFPFNGVVFDRLIAAFAYKSNAGFLIYVADFFGYLASVGVLAYKSFFQKSMTHVDFFIVASHVISVFGIIATVLSLAYFTARRRTWRPERRLASPPGA